MAFNTNNEEYTIECITTDDIPLVDAFLKANFYCDSPLSQHLEMTEADNSNRGLHITFEYIPKDCSFKAVKPNGEIIGVLMNRFLDPLTTEQKTKIAVDQCENEKLKKILAYIEYIEQQVNIFEMYPEYKKALYLDILSVNSRYRSMGIARKLLLRSMEYMKETNLAICQILCTNYFLSRLCEKLGFDEAYKLPFEDYIVNGERPLRPDAPHTFGTIFIKRI